MKPYRDAIKAADPNAVVALYFSEAGHPDKAWDNALASYSPKYWDAVTYHEYVFPGNLTTFDDLMAAANGNLFSNTTSHVTDYLMPKNNPGMTYVISEVSPAAGQGGPLLGTLYGGIYSAEFALRMSTLPQVKYVASFQMLSNAGIDETNDHLNVVQAAYNNGTTTNTSGLNFGFFLSAQAAGEAVANGALHNSIGVYATTTTGGPTAPTNGGGSIPAVYAQAYEGGNGKRYVVLTNKSASTAVARIMQDGADLTNPMQMTFVTGTDPSLANTGLPPDNVQIQTQTVTNPGAVTIPPYSVVRLEWPLSSSISLVANAEGESLTIAPNTWVEIKGSNLAPAGDSRIWNDIGFCEQSDAHATGWRQRDRERQERLCVLHQPDAGEHSHAARRDARAGEYRSYQWRDSAPASRRRRKRSRPRSSCSMADPMSPRRTPTELCWGQQACIRARRHQPNRTRPSCSMRMASGKHQHQSSAGRSFSRVSCRRFQSSKSEASPPTVQFAGLVAPGEFQFNVVVPSNLANGDQPITATYGGQNTQAGTLITIQN